VTRLRRSGFTLIELLVVIAIIGILAAMLFPVFARARESARKTQCLSNVKNIAMAVQMYISDYDGFMPLGNKDKTSADYFNAIGNSTGRDDRVWPDVCNHQRHANPYVREQVILDEYIKNREVWRCPSGLVVTAAANIVPVGRGGYWLNNWRDVSWKGNWSLPQACQIAFPSGWGGSNTDSFKQGVPTPETPGIFAFSVATNDNMHWDRPGNVNDAARYIVCGDGGGGTSVSIWNAKSIALPDYACGYNECGVGSPGCCFDGTGPGELSDSDKLNKAWRDSSWRSKRARHMGGSNVGFMDGHARWHPVDSLIFQQAPYKNAIFEGGLCACLCDWTDNYCVDGHQNTG